VDAGTNKGFTVGKKVCFYSDEDTLLFCEPIVKVRARAASIRLTSEQQTQLSLNMRVYLEGQSPSKDEFESDEEPEEKPEKHEQKIEEEPEVIVPPSRIKLSYAYTLLSPIAYRATKFDAANVGSSGSSVWSSGSAVQSSILGFHFLWQKFFHPSWTWGAGLGYSFFPKQKFSFDYDITSSGSSILTSVVGHLYSFNFPVIKHFDITPTLKMETGPGLSILRSQVKHSGLVSESTEVAAITSVVHAAAITGDVGLAYVFGAWSFSGDVKVFVPVAEFMKSSSGESTALGAGADASADALKTALAHKKNAFGAQILLSAGRSL